MYGFGERKTPKPFVAACDKFIYIENLTYAESAADAQPARCPSRRRRTPAAQLKGDAALVNLLRNAVEAASDDDGWAPLANVGHIITKQRPDFDSRNYGYAKLSDLMTATTLFELDRRSPGDGKQALMFAREKPARPRAGRGRQLSPSCRSDQRLPRRGQPAPWSARRSAVASAVEVAEQRRSSAPWCSTSWLTHQTMSMKASPASLP